MEIVGMIGFSAEESEAISGVAGEKRIQSWPESVDLQREVAPALVQVSMIDGKRSYDAGDNVLVIKRGVEDSVVAKCQKLSKIGLKVVVGAPVPDDDTVVTDVTFIDWLNGSEWPEPEDPFGFMEEEAVDDEGSDFDFMEEEDDQDRHPELIALEDDRDEWTDEKDENDGEVDSDFFDSEPSTTPLRSAPASSPAPSLSAVDNDDRSSLLFEAMSDRGTQPITHESGSAPETGGPEAHLSTLPSQPSSFNLPSLDDNLEPNRATSSVAVEEDHFDLPLIDDEPEAFFAEGLVDEVQEAQPGTAEASGYDDPFGMKSEDLDELVTVGDEMDEFSSSSEMDSLFREVTSAPASPAEEDSDDVDYFAEFQEPEKEELPAKVTSAPQAQAEPLSAGIHTSMAHEDTSEAQDLADPGLVDFNTGAYRASRGKRCRATFFTGTHGGAGKTTVSFAIANTLASSFKASAEKNRTEQRPVYLIEADYENPKLARRFELNDEQTVGHYARFLKAVERGGRAYMESSDAEAANLKAMKQAIVKTDTPGLYAVVCPGDMTYVEDRYAIRALINIYNWLRRQEVDVIVDANTLSKKALHQHLVQDVDHTVLLTQGDTEHLKDATDAMHLSTRPQKEGGLGIKPENISVFFNETQASQMESLKNKMNPYMVCGHLPFMEILRHNWIGTIDSKADANLLIANVAKMYTSLYDVPELEVYTQGGRAKKKVNKKSWLSRMIGIR